MAEDGTVSDTTHDDPHRFECDLDRAIRDQVIEKLQVSPLLPLTKSVGPQSSGIYVLYHKQQLVYVGKISKRTNITVAEMECRYLTFVSEWWLYAAEFVLMKYFSPEWNSSGFGSKMPGKGRPGTDRVSVWDQQFPPSD